MDDLTDVIYMVREYLEKNGYDGLYYPGECACTIKDIAPCGQIDGSCIAGHYISLACDEHDFHIGDKAAPPDECDCG